MEMEEEGTWNDRDRCFNPKLDPRTTEDTRYDEEEDILTNKVRTIFSVDIH